MLFFNCFLRMGGKEIPINHSINGRGKILVFRFYCELMQSCLSQGGNLTFVPLVQKRAFFPFPKDPFPKDEGELDLVCYVEEEENGELREGGVWGWT